MISGGIEVIKYLNLVTVLGCAIAVFWIKKYLSWKSVRTFMTVDFPTIEELLKKDKVEIISRP